MNIYTELEMSGYKEHKQLFDNIKILVKPEQEEIFRIIRKMKENYTENANGIFYKPVSFYITITYLKIHLIK